MMPDLTKQKYIKAASIVSNTCLSEDEKNRKIYEWELEYRELFPNISVSHCDCDKFVISNENVVNASIILNRFCKDRVQ